MTRIASILFHTLLFLGLLLAIDQAFVHLPLELPVLRQSQSFYRDLRSRLLGLHPTDRTPAAPSIEQLIGAESRPATPAKASTPPASPPARQSEPTPRAAPGPRYLYTDAAGQLQFADALEEIPPALRPQAQPLAQ
jgi:hypothetical protein